MKRAGIYVRVSSEEQKKHGMSVDSQIDALKTYCEQNNMIVYKIYNDAGISARKRYTNRTALLELIDDCQNGNIDIILFTKLDRWFRSVADYYEVQTKLDTCKVPWRAIWEDYETETSAGVFKVNIMLSVAQSEADRTSERVKAVLQYKKQQGGHIGSVPTGLKRINKRTLVRDEEREKEIEFMFSTYFKTFSAMKTLDVMRDNGYELSYSGIKRRMHQHLYCEIENPYLTEEQFQLIQERMKSQPRTTKDNYVYLFSGIMKCKYCGRRMDSKKSWNHHVDGTKALTVYYACTGKSSVVTHEKHLSIGENFLESYLLSTLDSKLSNYNYSVKQKIKNNDSEKKIKNLKAKKERIGIRFENGDISVNEYRMKTSAIDNEIAELSKESIPRKEILLPDNWKDVYMSLDRKHKNNFWCRIIKEIHVDNENKTNPTIIFL